MRYQTDHVWLRERLLTKAGVISNHRQPTISLSEMEKMQWGDEWKNVLRLMKNRMVMGGYRYGPLCLQKRGEYNNIADIRRRLDKYEETGNMEHLVDAANITIIECLKENHPNFHFKSIDDGDHAERKKTWTINK